MTIVWASTGNGNTVKTRVNEINLEECTKKLIKTLKAVFGQNPLEWNDDVWENFIQPWVEQYITNHFIFDGLVKRSDMDDAISIYLEGNGEDNG